MRRLILALASLALSSIAALAQSSPNLITGQVPTAAQWNKFFADKQDVLGYVPLNVAGGTMTGLLTTAASTATTAGFRAQQGTAPSSPVNGDVWMTTAGLFYRANSVTIGPLVDASGSGVTSVTANNASLTISPTAGAVLAEVNLGNAFTWTAAHSFAPTGFAVRGSTSGTISLRVAAVAGTSILPFPNGTTDFAATGGASQVLKQVSAGAALTVGTLACADLSNDAPSCATDTTNAANITSGTLPFARLDIATATNIWANTASKSVDAAGLNAAGALTTLTDAATVAVDMATGINFTVTLGGNRTLGAPTNTIAGRSGCIMIVQDGTGTRTLAYNSVWKFPGGIDPVLTTTAGAVDMLCYIVRDSSNIIATMNLNMS